MKLSGQVSIVTGGGRGLGEAMALAFAQEGSHVAVCDVELKIAEQVAKKIQDMGRRSLAIQMDVSKSQEVKANIQRIYNEFGRIDILVNNAGICLVSPIEEIREEDWDLIFAVNVKGVFLCSQAVMGIMKRQKSGKIINLGSIAGKLGGIAAGSHYSASKAAVMCFTKSLARELAPHGVRVNALAPGVIETDMTRMVSEGNWQKYIDTIPLGRIGTAEELAKVALFLASDDSSYLTGEIIDVNGGQLMD